MAQPPVIPAAQYVRMSTELQKYSLENQSAAISQYAALHGFQVVRTYTDSAKSGLSVRRREGLQGLLRDVVQSQTDFRAVLVYDVSRWGRFQDSDEAAHYEFVCRAAGVPVHYCAETFTNDGTLGSSIMKALKRSMAGEYSRELGVKVFAGQRRLALLGFKQGGRPGYGLRRMLVSESGNAKQPLAFGERKSISTDRVILVQGPAREVECVRSIYRKLIEEGKSIGAIVRELNTAGGQPRWDYQAVHKVLTHPKYAGAHVFGRTSSKLSSPPIRVPRAEWTVTPGAWDPLVEPATFQRAQEILGSRTYHRTDSRLLEDLRGLLAEKGRLSLSLIKGAEGMPSPSTYRHRFGGLTAAYEKVGYFGPTRWRGLGTRARTLALRRELLAEITKTSGERLTMRRRSGRWREFLETRKGMVVSVVIARSARLNGGPLRWMVHPHPTERNFVTLLARLDAENLKFLDFRVFSRIVRPTRMVLLPEDDRFRRGRAVRDLGQLARAIEQVDRRADEYELK